MGVTILTTPTYPINCWCQPNCDNCCCSSITDRPTIALATTASSLILLGKTYTGTLCLIAPKTSPLLQYSRPRKELFILKVVWGIILPVKLVSLQDHLSYHSSNVYWFVVRSLPRIVLDFFRSLKKVHIEKLCICFSVPPTPGLRTLQVPVLSCKTPMAVYVFLFLPVPGPH